MKCEAALLLILSLLFSSSICDGAKSRLPENQQRRELSEGLLNVMKSTWLDATSDAVSIQTQIAKCRHPDTDETIYLPCEANVKMIGEKSTKGSSRQGVTCAPTLAPSARPKLSQWPTQSPAGPSSKLSPTPSSMPALRETFSPTVKKEKADNKKSSKTKSNREKLGSSSPEKSKSGKKTKYVVTDIPICTDDQLSGHTSYPTFAPVQADSNQTAFCAAIAEGSGVAGTYNETFSIGAVLFSEDTLAASYYTRFWMFVQQGVASKSVGCSVNWSSLFPRSRFLSSDSSISSVKVSELDIEEQGIGLDCGVNPNDSSNSCASGSFSVRVSGDREASVQIFPQVFLKELVSNITPEILNWIGLTEIAGLMLLKDGNDGTSGNGGSGTANDNGDIDAGGVGNNATGGQGNNATGGQGNNATGGQGNNATGGQGNSATGGQGNNSTGEQGNNSTGEQGNNATGEQGNDAIGGQGNNATGGQGNNATGGDGEIFTGDNGELGGRNGEVAAAESPPVLLDPTSSLSAGPMVAVVFAGIGLIAVIVLAAKRKQSSIAVSLKHQQMKDDDDTSIFGDGASIMSPDRFVAHVIREGRDSSIEAPPRSPYNCTVPVDDEDYPLEADELSYDGATPAIFDSANLHPAREMCSSPNCQKCEERRQDSAVRFISVADKAPRSNIPQRNYAADDTVDL